MISQDFDTKLDRVAQKFKNSIGGRPLQVQMVHLLRIFQGWRPKFCFFTLFLEKNIIWINTPSFQVSTNIKSRQLL